MKIVLSSIVVATCIFVGFLLLQNNTGTQITPTKNNVSLIDGKQIVEIDAKGGYFPRITNAQANIPTVLRVKTRGTFDCSSALTIPSIGYRANLPPSGATEIQIPTQPSGSTLQGVCSMGMYNFQVRFN